MSLGEGEAENTRLIHRALEMGINFFDTADLYEKGLNEKKLGRMLKGKRDRGGDRHQSREPMAERWERVGLGSAA